MKKKHVSEFRKWLDENGLSYQTFLDQVNAKSPHPTLKLRTVISWVQFPERAPRDSNQADVAAAFPDCPILTGSYRAVGSAK